MGKLAIVLTATVAMLFAGLLAWKAEAGGGGGCPKGTKLVRDLNGAHCAPLTHNAPVATPTPVATPKQKKGCHEGERFEDGKCVRGGQQ